MNRECLRTLMNVIVAVTFIAVFASIGALLTGCATCNNNLNCVLLEGN